MAEAAALARDARDLASVIHLALQDGFERLPMRGGEPRTIELSTGLGALGRELEAAAWALEDAAQEADALSERMFRESVAVDGRQGLGRGLAILLGDGRDGRGLGAGLASLLGHEPDLP